MLGRDYPPGICHPLTREAGIHSAGPLVEAKSNPEHGLRLILTFKPETSFLVPLDRCIHLMKTILAAPPVPNLKATPLTTYEDPPSQLNLKLSPSKVLKLSSREWTQPKNLVVSL